MSDSTTRTKNTALNVVWAIISQVVVVILGLFSRKIFLDSLGAELLGVNSLFSDVLALFSFADLGFGTAIMFSMYKPIAEHDNSKVASFLLFYKKIYNYVICVLILISICFIPFLDTLKTNIPFRSLCLYYFFFQASNIIQYIWAYKESYVIACQRERILSVINMLYAILSTVVLTLSLIYFRSFVIYLTISLIGNIIKKLLINAYIANKYPVTNLDCVIPLSKEEKTSVVKKSMALLVTKIGNLLINQTDSLIASYMINVTQWGFASNYLMIKKAVFVLTDKVYSSVLPSMGNLVIGNNKSKELHVFYKYDFINAWIHTICFVALACLSTPFITLFFGKRVVLSESFVFIFFFASFIDGLRAPVSILREATGTYEADKWYTIVAAIINVIVSIPCAKFYGLPGVFIGTLLAMSVLHVCRTYVLFSGGDYKISPSGYLYKIVKHILVGLMIYFITSILIKMLGQYFTNPYLLFLMMAFFVLTISNLLWYCLYFNNPILLEMITYINVMRKK